MSAIDVCKFWMLEYLINSLWMVPLVFAAAWLVAWIVRRSGPQEEHSVWVSALLLQTVLPACRVQSSALVAAVRRLAVWPWSSSHAAGEEHVSVTMGPILPSNSLAMPESWMSWLAVAYGCVLVYFTARLVWGVWNTNAIKRSAKAIRLTEAAANVWSGCLSRFELAGASVAVSPEIAGPMTVGVRRAVLLLPPAFVDHIRDVDLNAMMAHECAHMRRWDFAKNLLYRIVSLPVAYHPVLWLTLTRITESREMICDAMAAEVVEGQEKYARSLLRLASMVAGTTPARTLHAIGIFDANTFERRVMRLTVSRAEMGRALRATTAVACVAVGAATCASALALRMEVAAPGASANQNEKQTALKVAAGVIAGNVIYQKPPVYPADAKANKDTLNGPVVLHAIISKDGLVKELRVKQSLRADYDQSALDAVKEWRYKPFLLNGDPTEVETTITVNYNIEK